MSVAADASFKPDAPDSDEFPRMSRKDFFGRFRDAHKLIGVGSYGLVFKTRTLTGERIPVAMKFCRPYVPDEAAAKLDARHEMRRAKRADDCILREVRTLKKIRERGSQGLKDSTQQFLTAFTIAVDRDEWLSMLSASYENPSAVEDSGDEGEGSLIRAFTDFVKPETKPPAKTLLIPVLVTRYVRSVTFKTLICRAGLAMDNAFMSILVIYRLAAQTLKELHDIDLFHLDLHVNNILVCATKELRVIIDFGITSDANAPRSTFLRHTLETTIRGKAPPRELEIRDKVAFAAMDYHILAATTMIVAMQYPVLRAIMPPEFFIALHFHSVVIYLALKVGELGEYSVDFPYDVKKLKQQSSAVSARIGDKFARFGANPAWVEEFVLQTMADVASESTWRYYEKLAAYHLQFNFDFTLKG